MMQPWQLITPKLILSKPIWAITPQLLAERGIRGLILDVDDTLVGNHEEEASLEVKQWLELMRLDFKIWLISNNFSHQRIQRIAEALDLPYRSRAAKPSRRTVRQALQAMELPPEQVAMVGDRLFTDTIVGNRLGMFTILVQPIAPIVSPQKSWLGARSQALREWEVWLARRSGVNI